MARRRPGNRGLSKQIMLMILDLFFDDQLEESVITTERLTLRLMRDEDARDIFEIRGDSDIADDAGVPCMESIEVANDYIARWYEDSVVIVLGEEVIGLIESYVDSELIFDSTFLGYYMKKQYQGKGYMTEALAALKSKLIEHGNTDLMLRIFPGNTASEKVAKKCGFSYRCGYVVDIGGYNQYVNFYC